MSTREPFSHDDEVLKQAEAESRARKLDRLRRYKRLFASADGKWVLSDLKRLFGFNKPSATYGMQHGDVMLREGMKQPFFHIDAQIAAEMNPEPKPRRAKSAQSPT